MLWQCPNTGSEQTSGHAMLPIPPIHATGPVPAPSAAVWALVFTVLSFTGYGCRSSNSTAPSTWNVPGSDAGAATGVDGQVGSGAVGDGTAAGGTSGGSNGGGTSSGSGSNGGGTTSGGTTSGGTTSGSSNGGSSGATGPAPKTYNGYASKELRIRIVGPGGRGHAVVSGGTTDVAGVLFGAADEITWQHSNGAGGQAFGSPFFQTGKVDLIPGDNVITVTAKNGTQTASDTITVTYNPVFHFPDRLRAEPRVVKVGKPTTIHAVVNLGKASNFDTKSLHIFRVDAAGNKIGSFGNSGIMADNGNLNSSGDEIKSDGLYSARINVKENKPGTILLRVSLQHQIGAKKYTAYTDIMRLDVVQDVAPSACSKAVAALQKAKSTWAAKGGGDAGRDAAIGELKGTGLISHFGVSAAKGNGVWVRFNDGMLGVLNLNKAGTRGGAPRYDSVDDLPAFNAGLSANRVDSKRALLLNPFDKELKNNEVSAAFKQMQKVACPAYTIEGGNVRNGAAANLRHHRNWYKYGVIATVTHGDAYFADMPADIRKSYGWSAGGSEEVIWTGHRISCDYFKSAAATKTCGEKIACSPEAECFLNKTGGKGVCVDHLTADLRNGRVVLGADNVYGILPSFVRRHAEHRFPKSLVYLGACRSLYSGSLASELFAAGAFAVVGYNGYVNHDFASKWGTTFFTNIISQKQLSGVAHVKIEDQANPGTFFSLAGAQNLDAAYSDIINRSWETGNLNGWIKSGDGRVIPKLGSTVPVGGKFMSIISTGLGYTTQTGQLTQKFCIQPGKAKMAFWWKYYSEEFEEFCGSKYQDRFHARIESKIASKSIVDVTVDSLCKKSGKCSSCGSQYKGLTPADVSFDKGGVFMTPWVLAETDVKLYAGKGNVTVRLFTTDAGDSIYDTAILIDKLDFK